MLRTSLGFLVFCALGFGALVFEPNRGQTDESVRYLARTSHGVVFVTDHELVFQRGAGKTVSIGFAGTQLGAQDWRGSEPTGQTTNYRIGRDAGKWIHGLQSFAKVTRQSIYPGVDLVLYGNAKNELEYDLVLAPERRLNSPAMGLPP